MNTRTLVLALATLWVPGFAPQLHAHAQTGSSVLMNPPPQGGNSDPEWVAKVREDLVAERFDTLDAMAVEYRARQTRVTGGDWQLALFYSALGNPHAGDVTMPDHLQHLQRWMAAKPQSLTAAVAYACSMHRWAWEARTSAASEKVTPEGWRLFAERITLGKAALDRMGDWNSTRAVPDPQWYTEYMTVALAQDWDNARMKALYDRAAAAAPGYFYLQKHYANYLLPKWEGKPGESAAFAKTAADALPGRDGDVLYWEIGTVLLSRSNPRFLTSSLDWPRLQRGHAALVEKYGTTRRVENEYALMAFRERDPVISQQTFAALGEHWSKTVWKDRGTFDKARNWANGVQGGTVPSPANGLIPLGPQ